LSHFWAENASFGEKWRLSSNWPPILYQVINQGLKLVE
jgi:hypothetical protein